LAEDCLPPGLYEGPLTRKLTLKSDNSAAICDPKRSLDEIISTAGNCTIRTLILFIPGYSFWGFHSNFVLPRYDVATLKIELYKDQMFIVTMKTDVKPTIT